MYQHIEILGRLGQDPEMRYTATGKAVTNISVAVDRKWKDGENWKTETTWFKVCFWGALGERVNEKACKGSLVFIAGEMRSNKYVNGEGIEVVSWELVGDTIRFCDSKDKEEISF